MSSKNRIPIRAAAVGVAFWAVAQAPGAQVGDVQKISATQGGFVGPLQRGNGFGDSVAYLGDLDGDGVGDVAVGASGRLSNDVHCLWVLFLHPDGTVKGEQRIAEGEGGFVGPLLMSTGFARALATMGDLDHDGTLELAVGEQLGGGGFVEGAVWILSLRPDGSVARERRIDSTQIPSLAFVDGFGTALVAPGDLDGDGNPDLLVGSPLRDLGGENRGVFYVLLLDSDLNVRGLRAYGNPDVGGQLVDWDRFGSALAVLDDLDGDGRAEIAVGAPGPHFSQPDYGPGAVWILFLDADGDVRSYRKITANAGGFGGSLAEGDEFGISLCAFDDLDGDGLGELVAGAQSSDEAGAFGVGAAWILHLGSDGRVREEQRIGHGSGGFPPLLGPGTGFGSAVAALPDLDQDGFRDLMLGSAGDRDGSSDSSLRGAVYTLFFDQGLAPLVRTYGCGVNPPGSLTLRSGEPRLGSAFLVGLTNPLGSQAIGSRGYLMVATRPHPLHPCGEVVQGLGMAAPGSAGEVLLDATTLDPHLVLVRQGGPWHGLGTDVLFALRIPLDASLLGHHLYLQGLLIDSLSGPAPHLGLSEALDLQLGSPAEPAARGFGSSAEPRRPR